MKNPFTYGDLLKALQLCSEEQLKQQVTVTRIDEFSIDIGGANEMGEDIYFNKDDPEDGGTLETLKEIHTDEFKEEDYYLGTHKNRFLLWPDEFYEDNENQ